MKFCPICQQPYSDETLNYAKIYPVSGETGKVSIGSKKVSTNAPFACRGCWLTRNLIICATIKDLKIYPGK